MSHHFDTETALVDGRLDLCDLYLFDGQPSATTVLIMTVNPFAGQQSPVTFHPDAIYEFKIDTNGDVQEEIAFRVAFGQPNASATQPFAVRRAEGKRALSGPTGQLLAEGRTGETSELDGGGRVWAGLAADPFFGNGAGLDRFNTALASGHFDSLAFANAENAFSNQNVTGIVLELPNATLGVDVIGIWATTSLWHPEEQVQINREANPLMLHLFHQAETLKRAFNQGHPREDHTRSAVTVARRVALATRLAGTAEHPADYGKWVAQLLLPDLLVYRIGAPAKYSIDMRNGRRLLDDAMDVALSLFTNTPFADGVAAERRYRAAFPYLAPAHEVL